MLRYHGLSLSMRREDARISHSSWRHSRTFRFATVQLGGIHIGDGICVRPEGLAKYGVKSPAVEKRYDGAATLEEVGIYPSAFKEWGGWASGALSLLKTTVSCSGPFHEEPVHYNNIC